MKIIHDKKPPIYDPAVEVFGVDWDGGVIFTYGDSIYCKYGIDPIKLSHEMVHIKQQGDDPEGWWKRYFEDPIFRLDQELEAYREENKMIDKLKDRNIIYRMKRDNARALSSSVYGRIISFNRAMELLK